MLFSLVVIKSFLPDLGPYFFYFLVGRFSVFRDLLGIYLLVEDRIDRNYLKRVCVCEKGDTC